MTTDSRSTRPPAQARPRRAGSLTFVAIRVTGLLLVILALGHFAVTHIVTDVAETGSGFVARRWSTTLWVTWDALLLACALTHAGCALVAVVRDYRTRRAPRTRWLIALGITTTTILIIGTASLIIGVSRS